MRRISLVALVAAVGLLDAGCGGGDQSVTQTGAAMKDESDAATKDESGGVKKDEAGEAMSQEVAMKPRAGEGVAASLLGTTRRANGKLQVTYDGRPLYYYVGDTPGNILCQNVNEFGGLWLVLSPGGEPVT